jgi:hypothetical protein
MNTTSLMAAAHDRYTLPLAVSSEANVEKIKRGAKSFILCNFDI